MSHGFGVTSVAFNQGRRLCHQRQSRFGCQAYQPARVRPSRVGNPRISRDCQWAWALSKDGEVLATSEQRWAAFSPARAQRRRPLAEWRAPCDSGGLIQANCCDNWEIPPSSSWRSLFRKMAGDLAAGGGEQGRGRASSTCGDAATGKKTSGRAQTDKGLKSSPIALCARTAQWSPRRPPDGRAQTARFPATGGITKKPWTGMPGGATCLAFSADGFRCLSAAAGTAKRMFGKPGPDALVARFARRLIRRPQESPTIACSPPSLWTPRWHDARCLPGPPSATTYTEPVRLWNPKNRRAATDL